MEVCCPPPGLKGGDDTKKAESHPVILNPDERGSSKPEKKENLESTKRKGEDRSRLGYTIVRL